MAAKKKPATVPVCARCEKFAAAKIEALTFLGTMRQVLVKELGKLQLRSDALQGAPLLKPREMASLATVAVKLQNLIDGLPTEIVDNRHPAHLDMSKLSDEELDALENILAKATIEDTDEGVVLQ